MIRSPINLPNTPEIRRIKAQHKAQRLHNESVFADVMFTIRMEMLYGQWWTLEHPKLNQLRFSLRGGRLSLEEAFLKEKNYGNN